MWLKYPVLFGRRQSSVKRHNLGIRRMMFPQAFCGLSNLPLARQEDQNIARSTLPHFIHCIQNRLLQIAIPFIFICRQQGSITNGYRIHPPGNFDNWCMIEMTGEAFRIDGR